MEGMNLLVKSHILKAERNKKMFNLSYKPSKIDKI